MAKKRLIDVDEVLELLKQAEKEMMFVTLLGCKAVDIKSVLRFIESRPNVDAVEVVHGRWEPREDVKGFVCCSVCHDCNIYDEWPDGKKWNYCPNCGAKMDGGS